MFCGADHRLCHTESRLYAAPARRGQVFSIQFDKRRPALAVAICAAAFHALFKSSCTTLASAAGTTENHFTASAFIVHSLYENWLALRKKDDKRHAPERLFTIHAVLYLAGAPKSRIVDHALIVHYEGPRPKREIPDFALDMHTQRGRSRRRGHSHFWKEGAAVSPAAGIPDPYIEQAREIRRDRQSDLPGLGE